MQTFFSLKRVSLTGCACAGAAMGLFAGVALHTQQVKVADPQQQKETLAQIRSDALERSKRWIEEEKDEDSERVRIVAVDKQENENTLLESARLPDMGKVMAIAPVSEASALKEVVTLDNRPTGSVTMIEPKRLTGYRPGLERFHDKLAAFDAKRRRRPVTVMHLGGTHVAADGFSRGIREDLQARYGDAGRGMVQPAGVAGPGAADQMDMQISGEWTRRHAMKDNEGRFGITGMSIASSSTNASMRLTKTNGPFDWVSVTIATGPDQGKVRLRVGLREKVYSAKAQRRGSHTFRLDTSGTSLIIEPVGEGETTVLNWATGKVRSGIRYVNFGLEDATADVLHRFNTRLMENDVRRIAPDLIVLGYGTTEGFDDKLDVSAHRQRLTTMIARLKDWAPDADFVFIGAASGLHAKANAVCNGWAPPQKLLPLRRAMKDLAMEHKAAYWDWSAAMGGPCAIDAWAKSGLAEQNRKRLTKTGYRRSARMFSDWLMRTEPDALASKN